MVDEPRARLATHGLGSDFVLRDGDGVVGYLSLTMGSVRRDDPPSKLVRGLPAYPVGVALLARLAVCTEHRGEGVGGLLLAEVPRKAVPAGEAAAARLVVVDAIDEFAALSYTHHGFITVPDHRQRLYWRIKVIKASLDQAACPCP